MDFGRDYYESVWGTVHNHDAARGFADQLINRFDNRARILDCGCGCGYLVKLLRDRGCEAWGVDVSDYAISESCAPHWCVKASVSDLPFRDGFFDAVFSTGMFSYVPEADVPRARDEIWRVSKWRKDAQIHNIDHDKCDYREDFATFKPLEWWNEQLAAPKVLVGCPTHVVKEYAHQAWAEMSRLIAYPNYEIFVVDNSPDPSCYHRWRDKIPMVHIEAGEMNPAQRRAASMEVMREKFLAENFALWWNVEIDVIPAPKMLRTLLSTGPGDWVSHAYPARGQTEQSSSGIGCSLFSRRLIQDFSFAGAGDHLGHDVDAYFWDWVRPRNYLTRELWGHCEIRHLKEP